MKKAIVLAAAARLPFVGPPPRAMPPELECAYTRCGSIPVLPFYVDDTLGGKGTHFKAPADVVARTMTQAKAALARNGLSHSTTPARVHIIDAFRKHAKVLRGANAVVFGSMRFDIEALLLASGAAHVTVIEYNRLTYEHPNVTNLTPTDFEARQELRNSFDVAVSLSSFDHDGLGRYGDPLAPDGDLLSMDAIRTNYLPICDEAELLAEIDAAGAASQDDGKKLCPGTVFMQVPVGPDAVAWNLHRRYGSIRLPLLLTGYHTVDTVPAEWKMWLEEPRPINKPLEPVFVLRPEL